MDDIALWIIVLLVAATLAVIIAERAKREAVYLPAAWFAISAGAAVCVLLFKLPDMGTHWQPFEMAQSAMKNGRALLAWPEGANRGPLILAPGQSQGGEFDKDAATAAAAEPEPGPVNTAAVRLSDWLSSLTARPATAGPSKYPAGKVFRDCDACPELVIVPPGEAVIGARQEDTAAQPAETPQRTVKIWPGFAIGRIEITPEQYTQFLIETKTPPARCTDPSVRGFASGAETCVTGHDASAYAAWLSVKTGERYRLPSAAEWEYAARWSSHYEPVIETSSFMGSANAAAPAHATSHPLSAMPGGAGEWTADCWHSRVTSGPEGTEPYQPNSGCTQRVIKDGSIREDVRWQRLSARRAQNSGESSKNIGFRVLRALR